MRERERERAGISSEKPFYYLKSRTVSFQKKVTHEFFEKSFFSLNSFIQLQNEVTMTRGNRRSNMAGKQ